MNSQPITQAATERIVQISDSTNVTDGLLALVSTQPHTPVYAVRNGSGGWIDVTANSFLTQVQSLAKGLIGLGVKPGDRVAVMAATSYHWARLDQALWFAGAISVPIYETSSPTQVAHHLSDSGAELVLVGDSALADTVQQAIAKAHSDAGVSVLPMGTEEDLQQIVEGGSDVSDADLEQARIAAGADDTATLVYTSGTTGEPKGAMITHRNLAEGAANLLPFVTDILGEGESRTLLFLPLAHVLARAVQVACLHRGIQVAHSPGPATLLEDLASFRPTWLLAVPRVFEKVYNSAAATASEGGKGRIFEAARATAVEFSQAQEAQLHGEGPGPSLGLRAKHRVFDTLVYSKLKARLGGCVTHMISGASPLNLEIAHFFTGIGIPVQEGYGLTESTAPITLNIPGATRIGSVGLPVPGHEVAIAEDGEVLLRGPVIFGGYWNQPEVTAEAFDDQGWYRTGDIGALDAEGYLTITGRKKEIIVTAGGKNVYPTPLEESVRVHPLVSQIVVVGESRPFVSALVTLDAESLPVWCKAKGLPQMSLGEASVHPQVREEVQAAVDEANQSVSRAESIRSFTILDTELSEETGHLTASLKLRRHQVIKDFAEDIEGIYGKDR